jgi:topoisomerase IV subunit A
LAIRSFRVPTPLYRHKRRRNGHSASRGKGKRLERYNDGGVAAAKAFAFARGSLGVIWPGARSRRQPKLNDWIGDRAEAGPSAPKGFPKGNRFQG